MFMRYRGGGVGHKITRPNNEALLTEEHVMEEEFDAPVEPIEVDREEPVDGWETDDDDGSEPDDEMYGYGIDNDHDGEGDEEPEEPDGEEPEIDDGEEGVEDIEYEEGYAPL